MILDYTVTRKLRTIPTGCFEGSSAPLRFCASRHGSSWTVGVYCTVGNSTDCIGQIEITDAAAADTIDETVQAWLNDECQRHGLRADSFTRLDPQAEKPNTIRSTFVVERVPVGQRS